MTHNTLSAADVQPLVLDIVKEQTCYSESDLRLDQAMEEGLGIDSIILASIVDELQQLFAFDTKLNTASFNTIQDLITRCANVVVTEKGQQKLANLGVEHTVQATPQAPSMDDATFQSTHQTMRDFVADGSPDLFSKVRKFNDFYESQERTGNFWYGMPLSSKCENRATIFDAYQNKEREFLMFASNNYLGLANEPRVINAISDAVKQYGATNTGCRLIGGTNHLHLELEERLARFKGREACIVFPSGYSANLGTISALMGPKDTIITDVYNHMSIQDGCKLSGAKKRIYKHNDMASLEEVLKNCSDTDGGKLIVADGVFSMHGNIVKLPEMVRLARKYQARILIDDAHSTGILGATGSGTAEHFNLKHEVDLELGTMSKTLAGMGGFVCGDKEVIDYLRFYANSYVFAATIPAHVAAGLIQCIDIMEKEPQRLEKLWSNVNYLHSALRECGFDTGDSESAIIPIVIGDETRTMELGHHVRQLGMFCQTVVFPGVAVGDARLRISVLSQHTKEDLDQAIEILLKAAKEVGLPGFSR
ncbi:aminotransferase class I/II-fold pyridoxal phosphate-dependent enzyme [Pseudoalteromonas aurantia]|uniref:8-amino-7-oxononanoate synthase n=1 Tax=Pseudoalteromonas aurantia TaxID=43654 RepID=A0A5S3V760_9GAMM|nr:aminotransferase class I/II-fold pyridoxal phosphate-dependent enzyme [Pseudoalteromonas aurantia]TMO62271.1 8-amino-7-oxononanoate synthase [Pseudoalteromonas aurantia]TMO67564.1 8-amino-7-oxononanoate synthase [Pseudoalteromonas aurantia]TMO73337.1 8-amino-7-oxononanoate synthase [Pseudoalteromonas aurantia]